MSEYGEDVIHNLNYLEPSANLFRVKELEDELRDEYEEKIRDGFERNYGREPRENEIEVNAQIDSFRLGEDEPGYAAVRVDDGSDIRHCEILYKFDDSGPHFKALEPTEEDKEEIEEMLDVDSIEYDIDAKYCHSCNKLKSEDEEN